LHKIFLDNSERSLLWYPTVVYMSHTKYRAQKLWRGIPGNDLRMLKIWAREYKWNRGICWLNHKEFTTDFLDSADLEFLICEICEICG